MENFSKMKRILKRIFAGMIDKRFAALTHKRMSLLPNGSAVYIFDIDNTIADTCGKKHLTTVNEFPEMIKLVKEKRKEGMVYFLSARNIMTYSSTQQWLQKRGFKRPEFELIFVTEPTKKIRILSDAISMGLRVEYYDDLCYNHENGIIKKYDTVINEVLKLQLSYKGIDDFGHLQQ